MTTTLTHAPWCDPRQHITETEARAGGFGPEFTGCVSAAFEVGRYGGWITSTGPGEPRIILDRPGHPLDGEYTKDQAWELINEQLELVAYLCKALTQLDRVA